MRTIFAALTCCLLVASLLGATAVAGASSTGHPGSDAATGTAPGADVVSADASPAIPSQSDLEGVQSEADNRTLPESIEIRIDADGDARFVLAKEFPTETDAQQRAFEHLADEYERGEHGSLGFPAYEAAFEDASADSDRSMELLDDGRHATRDGDVGRLEYRFTWTNFASVDEETVTIGDAFSADGDVWLELYEGQRLAIHAPDGYGVAASPSGPEIENDALVWNGPVTFGPGDLDVTFDESAGSSSTFPTTVLLGLGLVLLLAVVAVAIWWAIDRRSGDESLQKLLESVVPATTDEEATGGVSSSNGGEHSDAPSSEQTGAASDVEPSAAPEPAAAEAAGETVDPELLSDEERVEHLLEANGGRMKQASIVTETGWSNAKVSQLLSRMAEEERVDKLRIGRENLITLPDVDVTDQGETDS